MPSLAEEGVMCLIERDLRECIRNVLECGAYEARNNRDINDILVDSWMDVFLTRMVPHHAIYENARLRNTIDVLAEERDALLKEMIK